MRRNLYSVTLLLVLLLLTAAITLRFISIKGGLRPIPESALQARFGYMVHNSDPDDMENSRAEFPRIGAPWERAHPGHASWETIEPRRIEYRWDEIDAYVRKAQAHGVQILFTIWPFNDHDQSVCNAHLPESPPLPPCATGKGKNSRDFASLAKRRGKPCDMNAYRAFLRLLVERYDGDGVDDITGLRYPVKYWEIGNEPDMKFFFQGSPRDYFDLLKGSFEAIRSADPEANVVLAAPSAGVPNIETRRPSYWEEVFSYGAADYFDIAGIHNFPGIGSYRQFLDSHGAGKKPIWLSEPCPAGIDRSLGSEQVAVALAEVFRRAFLDGAERIFVGRPGYTTRRAITLSTDRFDR